jgi:hypothetical protein
MDWQKITYTEMKPDEKFCATSNIIRAQQDLNTIYFSCSERAIKSLFLINGGGIIAVLAYTHDKTSNIFVTISLIIFLMGLILVLILVKNDFFYILQKAKNFNVDINEFLLGSKSFSKITHFHSTEAGDKNVQSTICLGKISYWCTIIGIVSGILGYMLVTYNLIT